MRAVANSTISKQPSDSRIDECERNKKRKGKQRKQDKKQADSWLLGGCECDSLLDCKLGQVDVRGRGLVGRRLIGITRRLY